MKRHNLDSKTLDFTWKQNLLSKDKEALKNSMLDVIRKKPKNTALAIKAEPTGGTNTGMATNHGVSGQGGAGTMMGMQQAPAAF